LQRVAALGAGFGPAKKETVHVHDLSLSPLVAAWKDSKPAYATCQ